MKKKTFTTFLSLLFGIILAQGQITDSYSYDFRDGTIITNGKSDNETLTLSGTYSHHGTTYGMDMKVDCEINIDVTGSHTLKFLGSVYSSLNMVGTSSETGDLGTQDTQVENDLSDTYDFVYSGDATTLNFKASGDGSDVYLPVIEVIPAQAGASATSVESNIIYYFDLRDGSIIPDNTDLNGNYTIEEGLFKIECGESNAYGYNGTQHGSVIKEGNVITLQVAGNSYIKIGGCQYSSGTITVASETGEFDQTTRSSQTTNCYDTDGSTVDFLYVGDAGEVALGFTGTNYIPYIEIVPVPYEVELEAWVVKYGTINVNGTKIGYTSGDDSSTDPTITVSDGTVISATTGMAYILIDLGGNSLSNYTPTLTGDIASVDISEDTLKITLADETSNPRSYTIVIADNSTVVEAEAGKTYTYSFYDASVLPQTSYKSLRYSTFVTTDGILTLNSNSDEESLQFGYHDSSHGAVFFSGNSMDIIVAGDATITFGTCQYGSATDAIFEFTDAEGNVLGSTDAHDIGTGACGTNSFSYTGDAGTITATLKSSEYTTAEIYIHGVTIENAAEIEESYGKIDVWDLGAEQLDTNTYNNNLTVEIINSWYDESITVGSSGNVLPSFSAGVLSWIGGGNDRLRTTNTELTRYDENISSVSDYTGRVYVNSSANTGRYMSLALSEDDEVTVFCLAQSGSGNINFEYVADPTAQTDEVEVGSDITELNFVAKEAGTYHIFDTQDKPSYYRIYRQDASYIALSGSLDITEASDIPDGYGIVFENEAGKTWEATMTTDGYSVTLPVGYTYGLSLSDANGFVINNGTSLDVTESITSYDISIQKVVLYTITGSITGLDSDIANLSLIYTADADAGTIFEPEPVVDADAATYTVELEPNCEYTISADGVNDYYITNDVITITEATTSDIAFAEKTKYAVTITTSGLTDEQTGELSLTFSNLYEDGYEYIFSSVNDITLRDGTYEISYDGLDDYPVETGLISNLAVDGAATSKTLEFSAVTEWTFDDKTITSSTTSYKGLLFTGSISNEVAKGHLVGQADATIQVPVSVGDKITITYYYSADFSVGGESYSTSSGSTSTLEYAEYTYSGTEDGYVTITIGSGVSTSYITNIAIGGAIEYQSVIYVGTDKDYKTINDALSAISKMEREDEERVTVMIDPANYEEMLEITQSYVTLKNAADTPSIALSNEGVDIDEKNAVRITGYYGHGYNYYSMGSDQKWDEEILEVNIENGYLSTENAGAGTTDGSYWNATVVISADGFIAEDIIFENSFNQYISRKESEDVVVEWESGGKGERPTDQGNTDVQDRSYVERAAAIAVLGDQVILNKCRVVGRQDSYYGATDCRIVNYKGVMMGAVDYLFGAMVSVFYQSELMMNVSDNSSDASYLTAAQQSSGRGYLMYECTVTSTTPGVETASEYRAKPGYFGRPWQATTSEVVFYNTTVETTNYTGSEGLSLVEPAGWKNTLGGESSSMYEYGTIEESGEDNQSSRASWSTVLTEPELSDGTEITTYNFTKGSDGWDPLPEIIAADTVTTSVYITSPVSPVNIHSYDHRIYITNVKSNTRVDVYNITGTLVKSLMINYDTDFSFKNGLWIVKVRSSEGEKAVKVSIQ